MPYDSDSSVRLVRYVGCLPKHQRDVTVTVALIKQRYVEVSYNVNLYTNATREDPKIAALF